jgi:hypothetical protein
MAADEIPHKTVQKILELYLCSDDTRIQHISLLLNISESLVLKVVQAYTDKEIPFLGGRYTILNSEINY